jgi:hypothetical protein
VQSRSPKGPRRLKRRRSSRSLSSTGSRITGRAPRAYHTLQFYAGLNRDFPQAERAFHEGVEYCEERGIFSHSAYIPAYYTVCELDRGRWTNAASSAGELLRGSSISGVTQRVTVITTLALVRPRRGEEGTDELLDEALRLALPTGETGRSCHLHFFIDGGSPFTGWNGCRGIGAASR